MTAYQHGKHKDSYIVVVYVFFLNVTQAFGIDKDNVYCFSVLILIRNSLVVDPETLCASCNLVAHIETTRFSNKVVHNIRFAFSVWSSNGDY